MATATPEPTTPTKMGRKAYAAEDRRWPRSIALTNGQWALLKSLGTDWLIEHLEAKAEAESQSVDYVVSIPEVRTTTYKVKAQTKEEAIAVATEWHAAGTQDPLEVEVLDRKPAARRAETA